MRALTMDEVEFVSGGASEIITIIGTRPGFSGGGISSGGSGTTNGEGSGGAGSVNMANAAIAREIIQDLAKTGIIEAIKNFFGPGNLAKLDAASKFNAPKAAGVVFYGYVNGDGMRYAYDTRDGTIWFDKNNNGIFESHIMFDGYGNLFGDSNGDGTFDKMIKGVN